jgi:hypothetical protein
LRAGRLDGFQLVKLGFDQNLEFVGPKMLNLGTAPEGTAQPVFRVLLNARFGRGLEAPRWKLICFCFLNERLNLPQH